MNKILGLNFKDKSIQKEFEEIYLILERSCSKPLVWKNNVWFFGKYYIFLLPKNENVVEENKSKTFHRKIKFTSKNKKVVPVAIIKN